MTSFGVQLDFVCGDVPVVSMDSASPLGQHAGWILQTVTGSGSKADSLVTSVASDPSVEIECKMKGWTDLNIVRVNIPGMGWMAVGAVDEGCTDRKQSRKRATMLAAAVAVISRKPRTIEVDGELRREMEKFNMLDIFEILVQVLSTRNLAAPIHGLPSLTDCTADHVSLAVMPSSNTGRSLIDLIKSEAQQKPLGGDVEGVEVQIVNRCVPVVTLDKACLLSQEVNALLQHVLDVSCKAGDAYIEARDAQIEAELQLRNIQHCVLLRTRQHISPGGEFPIGVGVNHKRAGVLALVLAVLILDDKRLARVDAYLREYPKLARCLHTLVHRAKEASDAPSVQTSLSSPHSMSQEAETAVRELKLRALFFQHGLDPATENALRSLTPEGLMEPLQRKTMRSRSRSRASRGRPNHNAFGRSRSRSRGPPTARRKPADYGVDTMKVGTEDAAFLCGKGGKTKEKIARAAGCEIGLVGDSVLEIRGSELQRRRGTKYCRCVIAQRSGAVNVTEEDDDGDLTLVPIPQRAVSFVTGKAGSFLRMIEDEWGTLAFFCGAFAKNDHGRAKEFEELAIWGDIRGRRGSELKALSAVETLLPGYFETIRDKVIHRDSGKDANGEWGTDTRQLEESDLSYALGKQGNTRRKLQRACGAIVQYIGPTVLFSGTLAQRSRANEYMDLLFGHRDGSVNVDGWEDRTDCTVVDVPTDCVAYITGKGRVALSSVEDTYGTLMFFMNREGLKGSSTGIEKLIIFGRDRERRATELNIMCSIEKKKPGFISNDLQEMTSNRDGLSTDIVRVNEEDVSSILGKDGATLSKIGTAAGCILNLIGNFAFIAGERKERQRCLEYLRFLLDQMGGAVTVQDTANRDDCTEIFIPENCRGYVTGNHGSELRRIENETGVFAFFALDGKGDERLVIFGHYAGSKHSDTGRMSAERLVYDMIQDKLRSENGHDEADVAQPRWDPPPKSEYYDYNSENWGDRGQAKNSTGWDGTACESSAGSIGRSNGSKGTGERQTNSNVALSSSAEKMLWQSIEWLNGPDGGFKRAILYDDVVNSAAGLNEKQLAHVFESLQKVAHEIKDPTAWICKAFERKFHEIHGFSQIAAKLLRDSIDWFKGDGYWIEHDAVASAAFGFNENEIAEIFHSLYSRSRVENPTSWICKAFANAKHKRRQEPKVDESRGWRHDHDQKIDNRIDTPSAYLSELKETFPDAPKKLLQRAAQAPSIDEAIEIMMAEL